MIANCRRHGEILAWSDGLNEYKIEVLGGTFINDNDHIILMNEKRDRITVIDERGNMVLEMNNSDSIYLMYLLNHPQYGLSVVASLNDGNDNWSDSILSFVSGRFEMVSKAR